ncbi:hypothetical protein ABS71_04330 [bacterium SCN 62-11]|nr:nicotinamide mononucleotide transporter [Candidatus Eremiobacteraeota bacterium]ODT75489.1 MAG: hypothetical protein ABS71_04330 [bacterium SCN 62-11]
MEPALALISLLGLAALSQGRRWGWSLSTLASLGYVGFFWQIQLPGQAFLSLVYAVTQAWGWRADPVFRSQPRALWFLLAVPPLALVLQQGLTPMDAWLTAAALITQGLTAQKVSQVWRLWLVIDLASAAFYAQQGAYYTAALYGILAAVAESAHRTWVTKGGC